MLAAKQLAGVFGGEALHIWIKIYREEYLTLGRNGLCAHANGIERDAVRDDLRAEQISAGVFQNQQISQRN